MYGGSDQIGTWAKRAYYLQIRLKLTSRNLVWSFFSYQVVQRCVQFFRDALLRQLPSQKSAAVQRSVSEVGGTATPLSSHQAQAGLISTVTSDDSSSWIGARPPRSPRTPLHQQQEQRRQLQSVSNGNQVRRRQAARRLTHNVVVKI